MYTMCEFYIYFLLKLQKENMVESQQISFCSLIVIHALSTKIKDNCVHILKLEVFKLVTYFFLQKEHKKVLARL